MGSYLENWLHQEKELQWKPYANSTANPTKLEHGFRRISAFDPLYFNLKGTGRRMFQLSGFCYKPQAKIHIGSPVTAVVCRISTAVRIFQQCTWQGPTKLMS